MRRGYFGENGIWTRLRADFGGAAAGLDGSLREAMRSLDPKRAILAVPKAVIHIIPKSAFPQKWRKNPSSYRGFGGAPTNFPPGYPPIAPRRRVQAPSPKTAPKEAKRYTLQHYIILCQPTQIKGWGRTGRGRGGDGTFLKPKKETKNLPCCRESQADKAGRRQGGLRACPVAWKILRVRIGASAIRSLEYFPFGLASPALR